MLKRFITQQPRFAAANAARFPTSARREDHLAQAQKRLCQQIRHQQHFSGYRSTCG